MAQSTLPIPPKAFGAALSARLGSARTFRRLLLAAEGVLWTTAALTVVFLVVFHLDRWLVLSREARIGAWAVLGVLALAGLALKVLRPVLLPCPDESVAKLVERRYPALKERLLSAVEFAGLRPEQMQGFSAELVQDLQTEAAQEAAGLDFRAAVDRRGAGRAGLAFTAAAVLVAIHLAFEGPAFGAFMSRMALSNTPVWRDTRVQVSPYPFARVLKGSDLVVGVDQEGRRVKKGQLHFRFGSGRWNQVSLAAAGSGDFAHRFTGLTESLSYYATAGDGRSDTGSVEVVDAAAVIATKVRLEYPRYLQRSPVTLTSQTGGLAAPVGTRVALELRSNKPLAAAEITLLKAAPAAWPVRGDLTSGALTVTGNGQYAVKLKDTDGFTAPEPQVFPIKAIADQAPEVQLTEPGGDLDVTPQARVRMAIRATDDNGVADVLVRYETGGAEKTTPAGRGDARAKNLELVNLWELARLNLKPGDTIRYHVEATDWDNVSGPHVGKTGEFQLRIIDQGEAERRYEEQRADVERQLADLIREQQAARAEVAAQRAAARPNAEAVAGAEERQRGAAATAADLARRLADLNRNAETNNLATQPEREAQRAVGGKLGELAQGAMPQAADKIGAAQAQAAQPSAARSELGQAESQQEQILNELRKLAADLKPVSEAARLAERFERLAREQRALQAQADQLLPATVGKRMDELTQQERGKLGQLSQGQTNLQRATAQAMQDLEKAAGSMAQRGAQGAESAQQASQGLKQSGVEEQQSAAAQSAQQNSLGQARAQQEQAAKALENAAQELRSGANPEDPRQLQRQLQQAERSLQRLMQAAAEASEQAKRLQSPQQRRELERLQRELAKQAEALARQLQRLERRSPSAGKSASALQAAAKSMSQAAQSTSQGQDQQSQEQREQAERSLQRAMQSLQQASAEAGQKDDDPFAELRRTLTGLANGQKALAEETRKVAEDQAKRGTAAEDATTLQRLARHQGELAGATERLEPQLPGDVFRSVSQSARTAMSRAKTALDAADPKDDPTGRAQERARSLLDQLVRALSPDPKDNDSSQGGGEGEGGQGGQGGEKDPDLPKRIAEIRLLRFMEQDIRSRTQELDDSRKPEEPLPDEARRQVEETARTQASAKAMAERVGRALGRYPSLGGKVGQAGKHMGEAQRGLDRTQTGDGVQEQETQAIIRLTEALKQAQQQARSQSQSQSRQQSQGRQQGQQQRGQQAGAPQQGTAQNGNAPAMRSLQRRANRTDGPLGTNPFGSRGFGGLDPRAQDALRQSFKEKSPAEYQELIDRYYRALSNKGR